MIGITLLYFLAVFFNDIMQTGHWESNVDFYVVFLAFIVILLFFLSFVALLGGLVEVQKRCDLTLVGLMCAIPFQGRYGKVVRAYAKY